MFSQSQQLLPEIEAFLSQKSPPGKKQFACLPGCPPAFLQQTFRGATPRQVLCHVPGTQNCVSTCPLKVHTLGKEQGCQQKCPVQSAAEERGTGPYRP